MWSKDSHQIVATVLICNSPNFIGKVFYLHNNHPFFFLPAMALYKQEKNQIRQTSDHYVSLSDKWLDVNWSLIGKKKWSTICLKKDLSKDEMNNTALMYSDIFIPVTRVFTSSKGSAFPLPDDNITANAQYRAKRVLRFISCRGMPSDPTWV